MRLNGFCSVSGKELLESLVYGPYTDKTGVALAAVFAPEIEPLTAIMYAEMRYLGLGDGREWEELASEEKRIYLFVIERLLVEREMILSFFANDSDVV